MTGNLLSSIVSGAIAVAFFGLPTVQKPKPGGERACPCRRQARSPHHRTGSVSRVRSPARLPAANPSRPDAVRKPDIIGTVSRPALTLLCVRLRAVGGAKIS
jgi:hypothetical protein